MKISLINTGKRFNRTWIFRKLSYEFTVGNAYAIIGPNGSGKSTLLQIIGGAMDASEGAVKYTDAGNDLAFPNDTAYKFISMSAPYLELIEEMTGPEFLAFHQQFKPLLPQLSIPQIISVVGLRDTTQQIRYYSSGMKQRIKLAQAIFSDVPCILLDEPCTNLDEDGIALYHTLIGSYCRNRLLVISSNDEMEFSFCPSRIDLQQYK